MKNRSWIYLLTLSLSLNAAVVFAQGGGSGGGAGSGAGSSGSGTIGGGGGSGAETDDGAGSLPSGTGEGTGASDDNSIDDGFNRGDSAPRTEPPIREDIDNTRPRVPPEPVDGGGAGSTGGETDGDQAPAGTIENAVPDDAGVEAPDETSGDRDLTRELNGTAGSRLSTR